MTGELAATYYLELPHSDDLVTPGSLAFTTDGRGFVAGALNHVFLIDMERQYSVLGGPTSIVALPTRVSHGTPGIAGLVSALSISEPGGLLAAGTMSRQIGLYENEGWGMTDSVIRLDLSSSKPMGSGVTSLRWSSDGRYLYVAERMSTKILLFDIRYAREQLLSLEGRSGRTQQRLDVEVVETEQGTEVWAGGMDGGVVKWSNPQKLPNGSVLPSARWKGHGGK